MRKINFILITAMFLLLPHFANAQFIGTESLTSNADGRDICEFQDIAQSFTVQNPCAVTNASAKLRNSGSTPSAGTNYTFYLFNHSGSAPLLEIGRFIGLDGSRITSSTLSFFNFSAKSSNITNLAVGVTYVLVGHSAGPCSPSTQAVTWGRDSTEPYANGSAYSGNGNFTSWSSLVEDESFVIYCNQTTAEIPDTTPPEITYYNLTNSTNGCENWNISKTNACKTSAVLPTVQFNTNESAWCAISGNFSSTPGINYTDMGSSRNCTGAASGEGTMSHLCTLTLQDELVYETSYLYISCKSSGDNQNRTSTSGPLSINITGLESTSKDSMEVGIANALSTSYSTYNDQKIYARNSANAQSVGTFDKVVKKLNKIWAFNRIGISDAYVNMFNITPVLYTWEFTNKTQTYIENQTAAFINATK